MNLFDLFARITLDDDDYKKKLGDNEKHTSSFADKLKAGFSAVGKAAAVGLAAAGSAAKNKILPFFHRQRDTIQSRTLCCRVTKGQILDTEMCHATVSFPCKITGIKR